MKKTFLQKAKQGSNFIGVLHEHHLHPQLCMSNLYDLFSIFSLIVIVINHITSLKQTHLFPVYFLESLLSFLEYNMDEESE